MNGDRLIYFLSRLSGRERGLLLVLGVVFVPLAVYFLAITPLFQARDAARAGAFEARTMLHWVSGQVAELPAGGLAAPVSAAPAPEPIGISGIEQSLVRAALRDRVSTLANRSGGGVELAFDEVPFDELTSWLQATAPDWGYRIAEFRIERTDRPGVVAAVFELEAAE